MKLATVVFVLLAGLCGFAAALAGGGAFEVGTAQETATEAMRLATANRIGDALPLFRKAVRMAPFEPNYWNNLGVTALRLGLWGQAEASFMVAIALSPNNYHADAGDNLKETREYMVEKGIKTRQGTVVHARDEAMMSALKATALGEVVPFSPTTLSDAESEDEAENTDDGEETTDEEGDEEDEESPPPIKAGGAAKSRNKDEKKKRSSRDPELDDDEEDEDDNNSNNRKKSKKSENSSPMTWSEFVRSRKIKHPLGRIPRIHIAELLASPSLRQQYLRGQRPFIILGTLSFSRKLLALAKPDASTFLAEEDPSAYAYGEEGADEAESVSARHIRDALAALASQSMFGSNSSRTFYTEGRFASVTSDFYPANMDEKEVRPYLTPLKEAINELVAYSRSNHDGDGDDDGEEEGQEEAGGGGGGGKRFPMPSSHHPGRYLHFNMGYKDWQRLVGPLSTSASYYASSPAKAGGEKPVLHSAPFDGMGLRVPPGLANTDEWIASAFDDDDDERDEFQRTQHWRMLLVGTEGAGMFFHQDTLATASWQLQLAGTKVWTLCHPDQSRFLNSDLDTFNPDYHRFPEAAKVEAAGTKGCWLEMIRAGEMVFYPNAYWHQTLNFASPAAFKGVGISADGNGENNNTGHGIPSIWDDKPLQEKTGRFLQRMIEGARRKGFSESRMQTLLNLQKELEMVVTAPTPRQQHRHYLFSVGLTDTLADWSNHRQLGKDLEANCRRPNRVPGIHASDKICVKFPRFIRFWEEAYGQQPLSHLSAASSSN